MTIRNLANSVDEDNLPMRFGHETARKSRVKRPPAPAHLSTTHGRGFTMSLLMLNVKHEKL